MQIFSQHLHFIKKVLFGYDEGVTAKESNDKLEEINELFNQQIEKNRRRKIRLLKKEEQLQRINRKNELLCALWRLQKLRN